jgi:hypothetical protein
LSFQPPKSFGERERELLAYQRFVDARQPSGRVEFEAMTGGTQHPV